MGRWLVMPVDQLVSRTWIDEVATKAYLDHLVAVGGPGTESQPGVRLKLSADCLADTEKTTALISAMDEWATQLKLSW